MGDGRFGSRNLQLFFLEVFPDLDWPVRNRIAGFISAQSRSEDFPSAKARKLLLDSLEAHRFNYNEILALGAVGESDDVEFIRALYNERMKEEEARWKRHYQQMGQSFSDFSSQTNKAVRWACARLGDPTAMKEMEEALVPPQPGSEQFESRGVWGAYLEEVDKVVYVGRLELLPALKESLNYDAEPTRFVCFSVQQPTPP